MQLTDNDLSLYIQEASDLLMSSLPSDEEISKHVFSDGFNRRMKKLIRNSERTRGMRICVKAVKWAAAAACIIFLAAMILPSLTRRSEDDSFDGAANENADGVGMYDSSQNIVFITWQEALTYEPFGEFLPSQIPDGFTATDTVEIYNDSVMKAELHDASGYSLSVEIAQTDYSPGYSAGSSNTIIYSNDGSSYLYIECGDYVVLYTFDSDLNTINDLEEMLYSSAYFSDQS